MTELHRNAARLKAAAERFPPATRPHFDSPADERKLHDFSEAVAYPLPEALGALLGEWASLDGLSVSPPLRVGSTAAAAFGAPFPPPFAPHGEPLIPFADDGDGLTWLLAPDGRVLSCEAPSADGPPPLRLAAWSLADWLARRALDWEDALDPSAPRDVFAEE